MQLIETDSLRRYLVEIGVQSSKLVLRPNLNLKAQCVTGTGTYWDEMGQKTHVYVLSYVMSLNTNNSYNKLLYRYKERVRRRPYCGFYRLICLGFYDFTLAFQLVEDVKSSWTSENRDSHQTGISQVEFANEKKMFGEVICFLQGGSFNLQI